VLLCENDRCFEARQLVPPGNPMVCHQAKPKAHLNAVRCCKDVNFCNKQTPPTLAPPPSTISSGAVFTAFLIYFFILCFLGGLFSFSQGRFIFVYLKCVFGRKRYVL